MFRKPVITLVLPFLCAVTACGRSATAPTAPGAALTSPLTASQAERCANVTLGGTAPLGLIDGALGALPTPVTIAGVDGMLGSVITSRSASGVDGQGAQHITLRHQFTSGSGTFATDDRAVCAPAGSDPNVCRVNDVMEIVSGTGVFANASGQLVNHGTIDLNTFTLFYSARGRVCGDGL
jgi:hypothetical protein